MPHLTLFANDIVIVNESREGLNYKLNCGELWREEALVSMVF